jgi:hypothetical protein
MFIHPEVMRELAEGRMQDMRREQARRARIAPSRYGREQADPTIALRLCRVGDDPALAELAALEQRPVPEGQFVIAELDGRIVAALPLDGGPALRDPFVRTAHLQRLLELRVAQLNCRERTGWSLPRGFRQLRHWASA